MRHTVPAVVTYKCDKCGKGMETPKLLTDTKRYIGQRDHNDPPPWEAELCEPCLDELKALATTAKRAEEAKEAKNVKGKAAQI